MSFHDSEQRADDREDSPSKRAPPFLLAQEQPVHPLCPSPCIFLVINGSFLFPESWTFTGETGTLHGVATWQHSVGGLVELAISALGGGPPRTGAVPWGGHSQAPTPDAAGLGTFLPPDVQSTLGAGSRASSDRGILPPAPLPHRHTARPGRNFLQVFPVHLSGCNLWDLCHW